MVRCHGDCLPLRRVPIIRRAGPAPTEPRHSRVRRSGTSVTGRAGTLTLRGQSSEVEAAKGPGWFQELSLVVAYIPRAL